MTDHDPKRDLVLERYVAVPVEKVWAAWTEPELILQWFTPAPWKTVECKIDLRPGGRFYTLMRGPAGEEHAGDGCFLEVEAPKRLVWTSALGPGYRPNPVQHIDLSFTAMLDFQPKGGGTVYTARAIHGTEAAAKTHAEMGFADGWGAALDQLVALMSRA
ncbi:MAG: SRPBCC family protein [Tabrizicola sp.]|nr:SRPBCC family protein [Tabrizicola sp.]